MVKFGLVVFELCERKDKQTTLLITVLCTSPGGEVTTSRYDLLGHPFYEKERTDFSFIDIFSSLYNSDM